MFFRRIGALPSLEMKDAVQQEPSDEPVTEGIPVVGQGVVVPDVVVPGMVVVVPGMVVPGMVVPSVVVPIVEGDVAVLGITMPIGGLNPPVPSSVEPSGIPTRPTDDIEPIPVGDDADAARDPDLLVAAAHVPDAVPAIPPPSKMVVEPDVPPEDEVVELPIPGDAWESEPPEHIVLVPGPKGDVPDVMGLIPGDASSMAPSGIPVGATGEPGPMPSGDVMPRGDGLLPVICANAGPQPNTAVMTMMIAALIILVSSAMSPLRKLAPRSGKAS
jgi:hypothetical protein